MLLLPRASRRGHEQVAATRVPLARAARARQEVVDVVSEGGGALSRAYLQGAAKAVEAAMGAAAADTVGPEASDTMRLSYADRRLVVCRVLPGNAAPGDGASSEAASSKVATAPAGAVGVAADTLTPPPPRRLPRANGWGIWWRRGRDRSIFLDRRASYLLEPPEFRCSAMCTAA